ncbi:N,N-dimethylformamidase beta subunit family domain-containing protein [Streptomyces sp. NPDC050617]|uniref:N,N-dimethylformamidase beta subunit family domain-containing protein n=1 Tax=Streptomyces sp. NPDC050617 TaxID=3154628 RepID=UPI0034286B3B
MSDAPPDAATAGPAATPGAASGPATRPAAFTVDGYPGSPSVRAGETLRLHVSTRAERFRADFFRCGAAVRHMGAMHGTGRYAPPRGQDEDWGWPGHDFDVPEEWPSGVYVAVLSPYGDGSYAEAPEVPADAEELDARHSRLLFVVTAREPARTTNILYKVPVFTYHAYNISGGGSLYGPVDPDDPAPHTGTVTVSLRRPGGGIGGPVKGRPDPHDPRTPRQTFAHWDAPFIAWLEGTGLTADYCTDLDLHESPGISDRYQLLISVGHDEYWSAPIRDNVTAFRDRGGNVALFGANTCWWRVEVTDGGTAVRCAKYPPGVPRGADVDQMRGAPDHWWETEPENTLTGVSYRNAGGHWEGPRAPLGFTVQGTDHKIFADTDLHDGDVLGAEHRLVGYECDGAAFTRDSLGRAVATGKDGTPADFTVLGVADLPQEPAAGWHTAAREDPAPERAATFGLYTRGGTVFTAATTDWPRLLPLDARVRAITGNVITLLS